MTAIITLNASDNVCVATEDLRKGTVVIPGLAVQQDVSYGHKIALEKINSGSPITKYGQCIGVASSDIDAGEHVHIHNMAFANVGLSQDAAGGATANQSDFSAASFQGYLRDDGKVGTRNYIGIMATVNCSATVVAKVARVVESELESQSVNVDGVIPIVHQSGCGIPASTQSELSLLQRLLGGYLSHPNFFGWVVVGLGCEVNQIETLLESANQLNNKRIKTVGIQSSGGTAEAIKSGIAMARDLIIEASQCQRTEQPASKLTLGLQCGGSDAWSGITANPSLGVASDLLVQQGGTAILAETPEIYGAENLLYQRCASDSVKGDLEQKVDWWKHYLSAAKTDLNNNPSPGNLAGGITTILEKSLGAVAKGGQSTLSEVLEYAQPPKTSGLVFMDSPGFDPCSVTGEIASGANIICFTTGRGSTFGAAGAPSIKLASNSNLYTRMSDDMDINCGLVASGDKTVDQTGRHVFETILAVASGQPTKSEVLGLGCYEFVPWHKGVVV